MGVVLFKLRSQAWDSTKKYFISIGIHKVLIKLRLKF